jgi:kynurenine formamidase
MSFPFKIIDLTYPLSPTTPSWNGRCGFEHQIKMDYSDNTRELSFRVQQIKMHAGIGTHIDAPSHCVPGGKSIADLDLNDLIAPCAVIDVSQQSHASYCASAEDIRKFEQTHGPLQPKSFVIFRTGWDQFWEEPEKYRNNFMFPSIAEDAALLLLDRNIVGLGIDTLSPDRPDNQYKVHKAILGAGKYIVENVANASSLPPIGSYSLALPIKTVGGTEAPMRFIALV